MKDDKLVVKPVAWYDGAQYPQRDTHEGEAVRKSLGKKLGSAMLAAALGLTLAACDSGCMVTGPPPMRPDTKTEDAAKKAIQKQAGTQSPADTATSQPKTEK